MQHHLHLSRDFEATLARHLKQENINYGHFYPMPYDSFRKLLGGNVRFSEHRTPELYKVQLVISTTYLKDGELALLQVDRHTIDRSDLLPAIIPHSVIQEALPKVMRRMLASKSQQLLRRQAITGARMHYAPLIELKHSFLGVSINPTFSELELHIQFNLGEVWRLEHLDGSPVLEQSIHTPQNQAVVFNKDSLLKTAQLLSNEVKDDTWVNIKVPTRYYQALTERAASEKVDVHVLVQQVLEEAAKAGLQALAAPVDPSVLKDDDLEHHSV